MQVRILFASSRAHYPQSVGGAQQTTHCLAAALANAGHAVGVLCGAEGQTLSVPDIGLPYAVYHSSAPCDDVGAVVDAFHPDIAVVSTGDPLPLASRFRAFGVPVGLYARDATFDRYGGDLKSAPLAGICAVSQALAGLISKEFDRPASVLPAIIPHDRYFVFTPGRFATFINPVEKKGVEVAFALAENNPDIPFLFVECWPLAAMPRTALMNRARDLGNIDWSGQMLDARKIYSQTRLLLVPSQCFDGAPRVVCEAQTSGIPVLGSDTGGIPECIGDGGMIADPGNITEWQEKLRLLWDDQALWDRCRAAAMRHAARPAIKPQVVVQVFERTLAEWLAAAGRTCSRAESGSLG